jgi:hypothetical protein
LRDPAGPVGVILPKTRLAAIPTNILF